MKTSTKVLIGVGVLFVVLAISLFSSGYSWYSEANSLTASIEAQAQNTQNYYDNMWKKVKEEAQVTDAYATKFKETWMGVTGARYGENGSQAGFQWIKEANPSLSSATFERLRVTIETGRNEFRGAQEDMIDRQRKLRAMLGTPGAKAFWSWMFDFPRVYTFDDNLIDNDKDGKITVLDIRILTSQKTKQDFAKGEADELDVFTKKQ